MIRNAQWLFAGRPIDRYAHGQDVELSLECVDHADTFVHIEILQGERDPKVVDEFELFTPEAGAAPLTASMRLSMNYAWEALDLTWSVDLLFEKQKRAGFQLPVDHPSFAEPVTDELLYPSYRFRARDPDGNVALSPPLRRGFPQFVAGNAVDLLIDGDQALPALLDAIRGAQHHVHLDWFFLAPDEIGGQIVAALSVARQLRPTLAVRVLTDFYATAVPPPAGQGAAPRVVQAMINRFRKQGIEIETTGLLEGGYDHLADPVYRARAKLQRSPFTPIIDHSKLIIIDGATAFLGGMNCAKDYLYAVPFDPAKEAKAEASERAAGGQPEAWQKWHDLFARVRGPVVAQMQTYFRERWAICAGKTIPLDDAGYFPPPVSVGSSTAKFVTNAPNLERDITCEYARLFANAKVKALVENPYFTDDFIATYLARAARAGALVDLILPDDHLDFHVVRVLMELRYDDWRKHGIKVWEYRNHMTHVKFATVDGRFTLLGGYNVSKNSGLWLYETGLVVDDPALAARAEAQLFGPDLARSTAILGTPAITPLDRIESFIAAPVSFFL